MFFFFFLSIVLISGQVSTFVTD